MQNLLCSLLFIVCAPAWATSIAPMDLIDVLKLTDAVIVGRPVNVDMVDGKGKPVTNPNARTGPGGENLLRTTIQVEKVLYNKDKEAVPKSLLVPHWQMWHMSLKSAQESMDGKPIIYLLKRSTGDKFEYAYHGNYSYELDEKDKILDILNKGVDRCYFEKPEFRLEELNEEEFLKESSGVRDLPTAYFLNHSLRLQLEKDRTTFQKRDGTAREVCVAPVGAMNKDQVWWMRNSKTKMLFQTKVGKNQSKLVLVEMKDCKVLWESKPFSKVTVEEDKVKIANGPTLKINKACELKP